MHFKGIVVPVSGPDGWGGTTVFPFVFVRKDCKNNAELLNHERIHLAQQWEVMLAALFLIFMLGVVGRGCRW